MNENTELFDIELHPRIIRFSSSYEKWYYFFQIIGLNLA